MDNKNQNNWWEVKASPQDLDIPTISKDKTLEENEELNNMNLDKVESTVINAEEEKNISDDDLMRAFIGKNLEQLANPFNFAAFFFGPIYLVYRKMIGYSLLLFLIEFPLVLFFGLHQNIVCIVLLVFLYLIIGAFTNKVYYNYALKKVRKLQARDFKYNIGNIEETCKKNGGTSFLYALLAFVIFSTISSIIIYYLILKGIVTFNLNV